MRLKIITLAIYTSGFLTGMSFTLWNLYNESWELIVMFNCSLIYSLTLLFIVNFQPNITMSENGLLSDKSEESCSGNDNTKSNVNP